ncbi:MAG: S8 family peptidase [Gemmatimonadetes bacterium]|nr:S8 family peptidase [Gemmatimonadota bacterium]
MKRISAALLAASVALSACTDRSQTLPLDPSGAAPAAAPQGTGGRPIPGQYIVVFRKGVSDAPGLARQLVAAYGGSLLHSYSHALKGFAARLSEQAIAGLERNPNVLYIEQDRTVQAVTTQTNATWGLDRSDQRLLPLSGSYSYAADGTGVRAYIVDTGIRSTHTDFGGRVSGGYTAVGDGRGTSDCNGHGTHVAGTVGGTTYGVAKGVKLVAVRVLDANGSVTNSGVIAGIDWVTANRVPPAVANMSLGGGASAALDDAVRKSISAGVTFAVAAGNDNLDACNYSPARTAEAITVGATTSADARASYSNYGSCLDLFAAGSSITSAWHTGSTATNTISGTSMATPHVAGVAALYLQGNPGAAPATVASAITGSATTGKVTGAGTGSPNKLLYSGLTAEGGGGGSAAPCSSCTAFAGSLSGAGYFDYQPNGTYYYSSAGGYHKGWLQGPSGTDFDLYLQRWNGYRWAIVAYAESATSTEQITYFGSAGYYRWQVYAYSGSGAYTFWLQKP